MHSSNSWLKCQQIVDLWSRLFHLVSWFLSCITQNDCHKYRISSVISLNIYGTRNKRMPKVWCAVRNKFAINISSETVNCHWRLSVASWAIAHNDTFVHFIGHRQLSINVMTEWCDAFFYRSLHIFLNFDIIYACNSYDNERHTHFMLNLWLRFVLRCHRTEKENHFIIFIVFSSLSQAENNKSTTFCVQGFD